MTREVRGGKTDIDIDVAMHGDSPHQWMSGSAAARRRWSARRRSSTRSSTRRLAFDQLAEAVNPFRRVNPSTELQCAVIRLPLAGGMARVDRSIAIETREIDASMSGTLDFGTRRSTSRSGRGCGRIPIEIPQIAELVRFRGTFLAPTVSVDAMASATAIARIGAAIGTGGLSVLGESILAQVGAGSGTGACEVALGKTGPQPRAPPAAPAKSAAPPNPIEGIGNALKGLFQR